ncbi:hypothetical protein [Asticcacaulis excentricus]|uniref:Uncharacterized protein n=1 Tax=Asticcacaulis excentricus (strain ATCC 15261 / DSM 4724 / KCTC 12464 / NCIMB 9791 / VKM B-1370 / CB 48) TaxID=573065 RepID=E8RP20_ASTEC|nr:hypothetical protein [Asticcacaulis excentricus]ADU12990.1 hypothetical protein Astex_1317 [Asticcacaulis excentricus CB 48]
MSQGVSGRGRDLRQLRYAEHFLTWALRTSVACSPQCRLLQREFGHAFGPEPSEGLKAFHGWLLALAKGRRRLEIGRPGLIALTRDEEMLLSLLTDAQTQDVDRFTALARFVMGAEPSGELYVTARHLMELMAQRGHGLPASTAVGRDLPRVLPCAGQPPQLRAI